MIYVGIDDTDTLDSRGTNQLAKALVQQLADRFDCLRIVRHQLLDDPRVPYTSKNGSASILLRERPQFLELTASGGFQTSSDGVLSNLIEELATGMRADFIPGSDPGLCVSRAVPDEVIAFALRCKRELMSQRTARELAATHGVFLAGLGGTEDGVIGALAAVGLATTENDGRVVRLGNWPDDIGGVLPVSAIHERGVEVVSLETGEPIRIGSIDIGKKLRPNMREGRIRLFARPVVSGSNAWEAVKLL